MTTQGVVSISADMESTAGIVDRVQTTPPWYGDARGGAEYQRAREWMSREVAAARGLGTFEATRRVDCHDHFASNHMLMKGVHRAAW